MPDSVSPDLTVTLLPELSAVLPSLLAWLLPLSLAYLLGSKGGVLVVLLLDVSTPPAPLTASIMICVPLRSRPARSNAHKLTTKDCTDPTLSSGTRSDPNRIGARPCRIKKSALRSRHRPAGLPARKCRYLG